MFRSNKKWFEIVVVVFASLLMIGAVQADWIQQLKITASDGQPADQFGYAISASGEYCIIGAPLDDDNGNFSGSAYIFKRSDVPEDPNWYQQCKLTASDANAGDQFGFSVSIDADYCIVGAWGDDNATGAAYIFKRSDIPDDPNWYQQTKFAASDAQSDDRFGTSVSIYENYCVVGAHGDDDYGSFSGAAYIFKKSDLPSDPNWYQQTKIFPSDAAEGDYFGYSTSLNDQYCIVGSSGDDDYGSRSGSAYIFRKIPDTENWSQLAKLTAADAAEYDYFGTHVAISGNLVIVGAHGDDDNGINSGSAYIFAPNDFDPNIWQQQAKLIASDGDVNDFFGDAIDISLNFAVVGAKYDDDMASASGSVYIFKRLGETWNEITKLTASDGSVNDLFGHSVSISGNHIIVGAHRSDDKGIDSGSAYVFERISADLNGNYHVDFFDYAIFAQSWLLTGCAEPNWCAGADLDHSTNVDYLDLDILTRQWLEWLEEN